MTVTAQAAPDAEVRGGSFLDRAFAHDDEVDSDAYETKMLDAVEDWAAPPPRRTWRERVQAAWRAVQAALACVRDSVGWLSSGAQRAVRSRAYVGRHHIVKPIGHQVRTTLLGRDRSTSEFSRAVQRSCREPRTEEGELVFRQGDTFVDWLTAAHESLRAVNWARNHTPAHGRWLCS